VLLAVALVIGVSAAPCDVLCNWMTNWTIFNGTLDQQHFQLSNATACPEVYPNLGNGATPQVLCQTLCSLWPTGVVGDSTGAMPPNNTDSVYCRQYWAYQARNLAGFNQTWNVSAPGFGMLTIGQLRLAYCAFAGPLGGSANPNLGFMCGSLSDFYCDAIRAGDAGSTSAVGPLYPCKAHGYPNKQNCMSDVMTNILPAKVPLSITNPAVTGDNLECRGTYALFGLDITDGQPVSNKCPNAYWYGTNGSTAVCGVSVCDSFCNAFNSTCNGFGANSWADMAYADWNDCVAKCQEWNSSWVNMLNDTGISTQPSSNYNGSGCRRYHLQLATTYPAMNSGLRVTHCGHAAWNSSTCNYMPTSTPGVASAISPVLALVVALVALVTRL